MCTGVVFIHELHILKMCYYNYLQGLFEYVRPSWEGRPRPTPGDVNMKTFGGTVAQRPTISNAANSSVSVNGLSVPR